MEKLTKFLGWIFLATGISAATMVMLAIIKVSFLELIK